MVNPLSHACGISEMFYRNLTDSDRFLRHSLDIIIVIIILKLHPFGPRIIQIHKQKLKDKCNKQGNNIADYQP